MKTINKIEIINMITNTNQPINTIHTANKPADLDLAKELEQRKPIL